MSPFNKIKRVVLVGIQIGMLSPLIHHKSSILVIKDVVYSPWQSPRGFNAKRLVLYRP
jgi:hypothetical protein